MKHLMGGDKSKKQEKMSHFDISIITQVSSSVGNWGLIKM
jgi:hypothetical protein